MGTSVCSPALSRINKRSSSSRFLSLSIRPTTILASLPSPQPAAVPERPSAIDMVVGEAELVSAPPAHRSRHPFLVWCGIAASSFCFSFGMEEWWLRLVWWIVSFLPGTFASFFFLLWKWKKAQPPSSSSHPHPGIFSSSGFSRHQTKFPALRRRLRERSPSPGRVRRARRLAIPFFFFVSTPRHVHFVKPWSGGSSQICLISSVSLVFVYIQGSPTLAARGVPFLCVTPCI